MKLTTRAPLGQTLAVTSLCTGITALLLSAAASAQDSTPTFYADALPLFQKNCVACHQPDGPKVGGITAPMSRSEEHTSELQSHHDLVCRLLLEKKKI